MATVKDTPHRAAKEPTSSVDETLDKIKQIGERTVFDSFPTKISKLRQLLQSPEWNFETIAKGLDQTHLTKVMHDIKQRASHDSGAPSTKRRKLANGPSDSGVEFGEFNFHTADIFSNKLVVTHIEKVKPFVRELVSDSNSLKMWISLMIPKIEDGNNFGVSVQEDTLGAVQETETEANNYYERFFKYYTTRAKLITKVIKYPGVEDYRKSVDELDEKMVMECGLMMRQIWNNYISVYDVVLKNIDKLKMPRNAHTNSMY